MPSNESRSSKAAKNIIVSTLCRIIDVAMRFIVRTVFIKTLSVEYLGVNGLFTNILTLLSFAELGIGSAITFSLYKPLAENDREKIKTLMRLFKNAYIAVAAIILIVGCVCIPFLNHLVDASEVPSISENLKLIFFLFLLNTALSYLFSYNQTLIIADQKQYIVSEISQIFVIATSVVQCVYLVFTHNFLGYLIIQVLFTLLSNAFIFFTVLKKYPFLKEKDIKELEKTEKKDIAQNVSSMFVFKLGNIVFQGTDNIIIAKIINVVTVGICSQYTLVVNTLNTFISTILTTLMATIGNINASESLEHKEAVFYRIMFISFWVFGFCGSALYVFLNDLIRIWLGEGYVLPKIVSLSLVLTLFLDGLEFAGYTYRITLGLFKKAVFIPIVSSAINITLSIILGKKIGLAGIFFATAIARLFSTNLFDPILVFRTVFKKNAIYYYWRYLFYTLFAVVDCILCSIFVKLIPFVGMLGFAIKIVVFTIVYNLVIVLCFARTKILGETLPYIKTLIGRKS